MRFRQVSRLSVIRQPKLIILPSILNQFDFETFTVSRIVTHGSKPHCGVTCFSKMEQQSSHIHHSASARQLNLPPPNNASYQQLLKENVQNRTTLP